LIQSSVLLLYLWKKKILIKKPLKVTGSRPGFFKPMKQFFTLNLKFLILIFLAYQGLKALFDPAVEGDPYVKI